MDREIEPDKSAHHLEQKKRDAVRSVTGYPDGVGLAPSNVHLAVIPKASESADQR